MTETVTPSSLWQGTPHPTSRWTVEQLSALAKEGRDPLYVSTATVLRTPRVNASNWTMPPKPVAYELPRLAITRDGRRAKIITPAGATQWLEIVRGR